MENFLTVEKPEIMSSTEFCQYTNAGLKLLL